MRLTRELASSAIPVCGIGASAGGVEALQGFFTVIPPDLGLAYVVIIHLAPHHRSELPAILRRWTPMPVIEVADHETMPLKADHVYVIAPDRKLEITDRSVSASPFDQPRGQRTAIDLFFRSLAAAHGDSFAVLLSGSGSDGAVGVKAVKERGGLVFVQDPSEAVHGGMPRAAIATGVADLVLPVGEIAARLAEMARNKQRMMPEASPFDAPDVIPADEEKALKGILDVLRKRTGHDFSKYKRSTVLRRLSRRMQLAHQLTIDEYLRHLRTSAGEVQALFDDLLISVTTFFRDPEAWAAVQAQVVGPLVERSGADEQLRVWVPGCATGEEAYTVAILLAEEFDRRDRSANYIVFGSDLDEGALAVAREGLYPHAIAADVSDARLERYFRADDDHFRVATNLRDHLVFAAHSLLRDPPFSKLHLISCRNLLIYLDRDLQQQIMSIFRYACRDDGTVFLGASESADEDLFYPADKKHRIFGVRQRDDGARPPLPDLLTLPVSRVRSGREIRPGARATAGELHAAALEQVAPPSVMVDERWNVLHMSPSASRFFEQSGGTLARRLTDLVRPELRDELHALLQHAFEGEAPQLSPFVPVKFNGIPHRVAVLAQQRTATDEEKRGALVTFLDVGELRANVPAHDPAPSDELVRSLRETIRHAERRIEGMRDDYHLTNEDLRAANEELQSLNEEYRSTTEELETSKEELQSINEELHTVNHELKMKLEEVSNAHGDLENLMSATNVATLFLTPDLRIKRFTPQLGEIFKVKVRDLERPIGDLKHTLDYDLEDDARRVLSTLSSLEREAQSQEGKSFVVRLSPYRTAGGRDVDGVVATFIDVTALKQAEAARKGSEAQLEAELNVMRRLHSLALDVSTSVTMRDALEHVLVAAIDLHGADFGNVQLMDHDVKQLRLVSHKGFDPPFIERFQLVGFDDDAACGRALRTRGTAQISDVLQDGDYAPYRAAAATAGYRAVQSVPLIGRAGDIVGVLSVHFEKPHLFSERDRQLGDMLGQQAAYLIEDRAHQESVQKLNEALRQRTGALEESQDRLSRQTDDLRQQDQNREEFLAALGHELRNPLAAIQSSLSFVSGSDPRSERALNVLQRQTQHMTRLINELLDVSRVRHGRVRLEKDAIDITHAVVSAVDAIQARAEGKGLQVVVDVPGAPLFVDADGERLAQILDNLLRNAVACTDLGEVTVSLRREDDAARVVVRDTGIGISPEDLPLLFDPYHRFGDLGRSGGLGLGLTLVKSLVEAHGSSITAESGGLGAGSVFSFALPLSAAAPAAKAAAPLASPSRQRVLVVDDPILSDSAGTTADESGAG